MKLTRSVRRHIPNFSLYGERAGGIGQTDPLHIEDIQSRSAKYLWNIATHRHIGLCQCVFVATGPVAVDLEESHTELRGPAVVVIPAGTVHGFGFRADSQGYVLTVDLDRVLSLAGAARQAQVEVLVSAPRAVQLDADPTLAARVARLLGALLQEFRQPDSHAAPVSGWLACSILWVLASALAAPANGLPVHDDLDRLRRFRLLLESHCLEHWPAARYAKQLGVSESSLNRLCLTLTGGTAFDAIQQRLSLEARRRLLYVAGSVAAIAAELGFSDPAYFCRFFRRHNGTSPGAFRRTHADG